MLKKFITTFLGLMLVFSMLANSYAAAARPFIIDTDVGIDDVIAMLYLLHRLDIEVKAITIESNGNAHCLPAFRNTEGLLKLTHYKVIPVACGPETPLTGNHHFAHSVLDESDSLMGTAHLLPPVEIRSPGKADKLLLKTLEQSQHPIDILALGPLTNLAELFIKNPSIKNKIHRIYLMGGAVHVKGNVAPTDSSTHNEVAEWNLYIDPKAADIVFRSGVPITLIPLDVTNQLPFTMDFYTEVEHYKTPSGKYLWEIFQHNKAALENAQWYVWDALAAVVASDESFATFKDEKLTIMPSGATVINERTGRVVQVCTGVQPEAFKRILLKTINS